MRSTDQISKKCPALDIAVLLHKCIPTVQGTKVFDWLKSPEGPMPQVDLRDIRTDNFSDEYLFSELLSKYDSLPIVVDRRAVAIETFMNRELTNHGINRRLANLYLPVTDARIPRILRRHRRLLRNILGTSMKHLPAIMAGAYFGPGTNIGVRFGASSLYDKVTCKRLTCTEELAPYALSFVNGNDFLARALIGSDGPVSLTELQLDIVEGAKLAFVPKNAKTDRSITVEPLLNSFVQNGIGKCLRAIIARKTSMTLNDQQKNQYAARHAVSNKWATVDLRDASNSITTEFVRNSLELCRGWFHLLDLTRSKRYLCPLISKGPKTFSLFSGMGNGFTFPLESLLFFTLAKAVMEEEGFFEDPVVYGDDILVPSACYDLLELTFGEVGFSLNDAKSFKDGAFRESCGKHYFDGTDVSPFYIRKQPDSEQWYYTVHNNIWKWASLNEGFFDSRVIPVLRYIRSCQKGPLVHPELGDVGYFPLASIRSKTGMKLWKTRSVKSRSFVYKGSKGYWCAMHQSLASVGHGRAPSGRYDRRGSLEWFKSQSVLHSDFIFDKVMV